MSLAWITKLILAHLLTDFVLQPKAWIQQRSARHFSSSYLYLHGILTAAVAWIAMGSLAYWNFVLIIFITHILIDGWKSYKSPTIKYFLIDQLLHLLIIFLCWYHAFYKWADLENYLIAIKDNSELWIISAAFVFLSFPVGIIINILTEKWRNELSNGSATISESLGNAGKWIGILERIIILIFLLHNQYAAIGLLIAAKGLLRFNEKDHQEKKTEYILIGSLISIGFAIVVGVLVNYLLIH